MTIFLQFPYFFQLFRYSLPHTIKINIIHDCNWSCITNIMKKKWGDTLEHVFYGWHRILFEETP